MGSLKTKTEKIVSKNEIINFIDKYNSFCSLRKSTVISDNCIWLGINKPYPKILINDKWENYDIEENIIINTRMLLTQKMVEDLIPYLQNFVSTGNISNPSKSSSRSSSRSSIIKVKKFKDYIHYEEIKNFSKVLLKEIIYEIKSILHIKKVIK